jgi:hypothetical protein
MKSKIGVGEHELAGPVPEFETGRCDCQFDIAAVPIPANIAQIEQEAE